MRCSIIRLLLLLTGILSDPFSCRAQCGVANVVTTVAADSVNGQPVAAYLSYSSTTVSSGWNIVAAVWTINGSTTVYDTIFRFSDFPAAGIHHVALSLTIVNPATGDTCRAGRAGYYLNTSKQLFSTIETNGNGLTQFFTAKYFGEGNAQQPEWNFGDGTGASGFAVLHTFSSPGLYFVTFSTGNGSVGNAARRVHAGDGYSNIQLTGPALTHLSCDSISVLPVTTSPYTQISFDDPFNYLYHPGAGILSGNHTGLGQWVFAPAEFKGRYRLAGQSLICSKMQDGAGGDYTIYQPVLIQDTCYLTADTLTGIFWEDEDGDGIRDQQESFFSEPGYKMQILLNTTEPDNKGIYKLALPPFAASAFPTGGNGDEFSSPAYYRYDPAGASINHRFDAGVAVQQSRISGKLFKDVNGDSLFSALIDRNMEGFIIAAKNQQTGAVFRAVTDKNGDFSTLIPDGSYNIYPETPLTGCHIVPDTQYVYVGGNGTGIVPFAVQTTLLISDLEALLIPERTPVSGEPFTLFLLARNNGNDTCKGQFQVAYDNNLQFQSFSPANGIHDPVNHTVTWFSQTIYPFTDSLYKVQLQLPSSVTADSLINQGFLFASPGFTDVNLSNNAYACTTKVGSTTGPFSKMVIPEGVGGPRYIHAGERLHYHLRYTNEGPGRKPNLILQDEVSAYCDMSSLRIEYSNRAFRLVTRGRLLTFQYYNVNLMDTSVADSSVIELIFSLNTFPFSPPGVLVNNTAMAFSDAGIPLKSNTVSQTIDFTSQLADLYPTDGLLYPNPCHEFVIVPASESDEISVTDLAGKLITIQARYETRQYILYTETISPGTYLVTLKNGKEKKCRRLIKE